MADYSKAVVSTTYSENADYSDPLVSRSFTTTYALGTVCEYKKLQVKTANNAVIDASQYASVRSFTLYNHGSQSISVTFTNAASATVVLVVPSGECLRLTDIKAATDITIVSASDHPHCEYVLVGICH